MPETNVEWRCAKRLKRVSERRDTGSECVTKCLADGGGDRESGRGSRLDDGCTLLPDGGPASFPTASRVHALQFAESCPGLAGLGQAPMLPGKGAVDCFFFRAGIPATAGAISQVRSFFIRTGPLGPSNGPHLIGRGAV